MRRNGGKIKIVVLTGGTSTERDVSVNTGAMIYKALKNKGHQIILLDVYLGYEDKIYNLFATDKDWAANIDCIKENNPDIQQIKALRKNNPEYFFGPNVIDICSKANITF
jgi:D-alanine-D-alanine ligase